MQGDGGALDAELARRADKHGQPVGIEITEHVGVAGLEAAGLLRGARAMARRVYGAEDWYVSWDGADIDALYSRRRATRFVVARRAAGAPTWRSHGGTDDDDDDEVEQGGEIGQDNTHSKQARTAHLRGANVQRTRSQLNRALLKTGQDIYGADLTSRRVPQTKLSSAPGRFVRGLT